MQTLTLIDCRGLMLRDYHGASYKSLRNDENKPVATWQEGLSEFLDRTLLPILQDRTPPSSVLAVWDGGNTYRRALYSGYKAKRLAQERDKVVSEQLKILKEKLTRLMAYLGVRSVYVPGEEADDLIALLTQRIGAERVIIRTVDRDLTQLIDHRVGVWLDKEFCCLELPSSKGFPYSLVRINKALVGDSSDEYGGVPQCGPKTWDRLFAAYGEDGLLQIQAALEDPGPKPWQPIEDAFNATNDKDLGLILANWTAAKLGLQLSTVTPSVCYGNQDWKKPKRPVWHARVPNRDKVWEVLVEALPQPAAVLRHLEHLFPREHLLTADQNELLPGIAQEILASPVVAWDYESWDPVKHEPFRVAKKRSGGKFVDVLSQKITGVSINYGRFMENTIYVPFDHKDTENFTLDWLTWLLGVLDARPGRTVVQNASFELTLSKTNLDYMPRAPFDTAIMSSYVDENEESGLKSMSLRWLGYKQVSYEEVTQGRDMNELTGEEVLSYGCDDSLVTAHLFDLFKLIMQCERSWGFYEVNEVEPVVNDVLDFIDGTQIDYTLLETLRVESAAEIETADRTLRALLTENASFNAATQQDAQQRARVLFDEWFSTARFKVAGKPEEEAELRNKIWNKAWHACFYEPPIQVEEMPAFVSTLTMLNRVIMAIDPAAPKLEKATGPGVEQFDGTVQEYLGAPKGWRGSSKLEDFTAALYSARKKLGVTGRSGPEYAALAAFCQDVLNSIGGKITRTGCALNTRSPDQMQSMLYGMMGLPIRRRSKIGQGSLRDEEDLDGSPATGLKAVAAAFVYDLPDQEDDWRKPALLAYKSLSEEQQKQSLYFATYPLWAHPRDGRVHPQIRQCGTATRRPSGSDPNVFQVSKKEGGKIRKAYLAGDYGDGDRLVISSDFANQELVITACESRDPTMLGAFMANPRRDLHGLTSTGYAHILLPRLGIPWSAGQMSYETFAAGRKGKLDIQGCTTEQVEKAFNEVRNKYSKACNFLICYLGKYTTLAGNLLIPKELAKTLMDNTLALYPRLTQWQAETVEFARIHGYTQTAYGNRRHAETDLYSSDSFLSTRQERQLVNATIQSTAADILKEVRQAFITRKIRERYHTRAVRPVYDEITASVPTVLAADYVQELVEIMSVTPPGYPVGMAVEVSIGKTWGSQIEVKGTSRESVQEVLDKIAGGDHV
jgi:DNA polymerase I-like protein with 3'-5' exonuclease and polymerase domains/5'-3' exonuclease